MTCIITYADQHTCTLGTRVSPKKKHNEKHVRNSEKHTSDRLGRRRFTSTQNRVVCLLGETDGHSLLRILETDTDEAGTKAMKGKKKIKKEARACTISIPSKKQRKKKKSSESPCPSTESYSTSHLVDSSFANGTVVAVRRDFPTTARTEKGDSGFF